MKPLFLLLALALFGASGAEASFVSGGSYTEIAKFLSTAEAHVVATCAIVFACFVTGLYVSSRN